MMKRCLDCGVPGVQDDAARFRFVCGACGLEWSSVPAVEVAWPFFKSAGRRVEWFERTPKPGMCLALRAPPGSDCVFVQSRGCLPIPKRTKDGNCPSWLGWRTVRVDACGVAP